MEIADVIIVGSGCAGAIAAQTLSEEGIKPMVIDAGIEAYNSASSEKSFIEMRKEDEDQSTYFLGKKFEVLSSQKHPNIAQQTAQRIFMTQGVDTLTPILSQTFFPVESLAKGGLGNGWGLGCCVFSKGELQKAGLDEDRLSASYKWVSKLIGISGEENDDAYMYCHNKQITLQPSIKINELSAKLLRTYNANKNRFSQMNISIGRPSLALLTKDLNDRKKYEYKDTDFYEDHNQSAFRPRYIIDKLIKEGKIKYESNLLVSKFIENDEFVEVKAINIKSNEEHTFRCKKLLLCAGTLATARIVLRSSNKMTKLPIICNPYTYLPMTHWPSIGKVNNDRQSGFAQLSLFYDRNGAHDHVTMASVYNYRSLLNFRILREMPINALDGRKMIKLLIPSLVIAGIFHPTGFNKSNFIELQKASTITGDILHADIQQTEVELNEMNLQEKIIQKAFRKLDCITLKKVRTKHGGSIHYAGSLPYSEGNEELHLNKNGKLNGYKNIYVGDASGLRFLPGKGLTLTIMAIAHSVSLNLCKHE